jgi:hypothetical protein
METVQFIYKTQPVDFQPAGTDNVMVNATQMAKIFNKQVIAFLRNDDTKNFISECLKSENSHFLNVKNEEDLITSSQKSGTWMHRILALKFAAWLDPAFELWVYITIDRIINHYFREQRDAMIEKLTLKAKKEALKIELIAKHPELLEYFDLEDQEKSINARRAAIVREQMKQLQIDFSLNSNPETNEKTLSKI